MCHQSISFNILISAKSIAQNDNLSYADDLVILAKSEQQALSRLNKLSLAKAGIEMSFPKTEILTLKIEKAYNVTLQGRVKKSLSLSIWVQ